MRFLVLQHLAVEHPGTFCDLWRSAGVAWDTVELDEGEPIPQRLEAYDAMVVMGGPMDVWETDLCPWLVPELDAIRRFVVELRRPYLGVCLGHQLLAQALGGQVAPAASAEVGPCEVDLTPDAAADALFAGLPSPLTTFQWHGSEVRRPPQGAAILARTAACAVQAFRWGDRAWGMQFHAEVTSSTVAEWQAVPAYAASLEATLGQHGASILALETERRLGDYRRATRHISDRFLELVANSAAQREPAPVGREA